MYNKKNIANSTILTYKNNNNSHQKLQTFNTNIFTLIFIKLKNVNYKQNTFYFM